MAKRKIPAVFFNASVILAGMRSPMGGSGQILQMGKKKQIKMLISEVIMDEVLRNAAKVGLTQAQITFSLQDIFPKVSPAPDRALVKSFYQISVNVGDSHVLAACQENQADFLVTLDKKHLLILQDKVTAFKIVSPGQLMEMYNQQFKK